MIFIYLNLIRYSIFDIETEFWPRTYYDLFMIPQYSYTTCYSLYWYFSFVLIFLIVSWNCGHWINIMHSSSVFFQKYLLPVLFYFCFIFNFNNVSLTQQVQRFIQCLNINQIYISLYIYMCVCVCKNCQLSWLWWY